MKQRSDVYGVVQPLLPYAVISPGIKWPEREGTFRIRDRWRHFPSYALVKQSKGGVLRTP